MLFYFKNNINLNADSCLIKNIVLYLCHILNYYVMRLQIKVFLNDVSFHNGNEIFERIVDVDINLSIPYESLVKSLRFMFGNNCIVSFNLM